MKYLDVPWYEWLYLIDSYWKIKWIKSWKILKPWVTNEWYLIVSLWKNWTWKTYTVHRLVMLSFKWRSELVVNHINWNKEDNSLSNLEYISASDNCIHAYKTGLKKPKCKKVYQYSISWKFIQEWNSISETERVLGISNISSCLSWRRKTSWGFIFKTQ